MSNYCTSIILPKATYFKTSTMVANEKKPDGEAALRRKEAERDRLTFSVLFTLALSLWSGLFSVLFLYWLHRPPSRDLLFAAASPYLFCFCAQLSLCTLVVASSSAILLGRGDSGAAELLRSVPGRRAFFTWLAALVPLAAAVDVAIFETAAALALVAHDQGEDGNWATEVQQYFAVGESDPAALKRGELLVSVVSRRERVGALAAGTAFHAAKLAAGFALWRVAAGCFLQKTARTEKLPITVKG